MVIEEYKLTVSPATVDELHSRLGGVRWPDQLDGVGWEYGVELVDSPVGLLGWFLEWYDDYGDKVGAVPNDLILGTVALTWFTGTAGSAARIYREAASSWETEVEYCDVPTGLAVFPGDGTIRRFAEREHNVTRFTEYAEGGHFAALEVPHLVAEDIRTFFTTLR